MLTPKWYLFYDFHTMPACPDVGARFDADAFAGRLNYIHVSSYHNL